MGFSRTDSLLLLPVITHADTPGFLSAELAGIEQAVLFRYHPGLIQQMPGSV